ncbi:sigma-70 family RNA polymerase sigma factor [Micromonospora matsumotoense]|uniref:RNA polymerase sigma factor n=1 Tax=Micromonospora matsumotoense TaxID=121616 RepID=UPI0033BFDFDE
MTGASVTSLLAAAAGGDESAWAELVRRYTPLVYSVIRAYELSRADAADVNQTVWLRLVEQLGRVRQPEALPGWLATTARRECYRLSRLSRRAQPVDPYDDALGTYHGFSRELAGMAPAPDDELLRAERRQALREGFVQLPPRCQALLALLTADPPMSYREVAERLDIPVGSIGPTQARCLRRLRECPAIVGFLGVSAIGTNGGEPDGAVAAGR